MPPIELNDTKPIDEKSIADFVAKIDSAPAVKSELEKILSLIDLTSLEGKDNDKTISKLCEKAKRNLTAAVCVYPSLVKAAKESLKGSSVKIASVAGAFPSGQLPLKLRLEEAKFAIEQGADEIDMVISRGRFLEGNYSFVFEEVTEFKRACGNKKLKVILETGELETLQNIRIASDIAIKAGADFIKTSTGKISVNASLPAVCVMLQAIKDSGKKCGIKPSGGISEGNVAVKYLRLTEMILGKEWISDELFRFGASRLVDNVTAQLKGNEIKEGDGY